MGIYDRGRQERLVIFSPEEEAGQTTFSLGPVWLAGGAPPHSTSGGPLARFGSNIALWQAAPPSPEKPELTLYWQASAPPGQHYTIFIHLLDGEGNLLGQADGAPYNGLYPLSHWRPGQIIEDTRPLPPVDLAAVERIAVGVYDPATGERLPATDGAGAAWRMGVTSLLCRGPASEVGF